MQRPKYLNQLINSQWNGFPKIITGIRRCGKSFLLKEIFFNYLVSSGTMPGSIIILDLDDAKNSKYRNPQALNSLILELTKDKTKKFYIFLDEIQRVYTIINPELTNGQIILAKNDDTEVISFVDVILGLSHEKNIDLYATGSNSKMLSSDIVTEFRDKATEIHMAPLSFKEYYEYEKTKSEKNPEKQEIFYEYMHHGGMPLAVLKNEDEKENYLKNLFSTTYLKDIIERKKLRKTESLDELCTILADCTGELLNAEKIANTFQSKKHVKIDKDTVTSYISAFLDAFIITEVKRYDLKGRNYINSTRKYYFCDTGLRNARLDFMYSDEGHLLETIVYNELIYNGYNVNVGSFDSVEKNEDGKSIRKSYEIDFMATKGNKKIYLQIADDISNSETKKREIRPFILMNDQIKKVIVINRPINERIDENGFTIVGVVDFLLNLERM
ncbi:MAG: ATP-binding protein [Treponemataceae bacterium]|nr:ATP-binding protein [Spirochaetales bacterium]MDY6031024.1 ATP-binding protein [Treponemataceae bacterium]